MTPTLCNSKNVKLKIFIITFEYHKTQAIYISVYIHFIADGYMPQESGNILKKSNRNLQIFDKIERLYWLEKKYYIESLCPIVRRDISKFEIFCIISIFNKLSRKIYFFHQRFCLIGGVHY